MLMFFGFNSKMVQLKGGNTTTPVTLDTEFQFQNGSIKRDCGRVN